MIINIDKKKYSSIEETYISKVLYKVQRNYDKLQITDPENIVFNHLNRNMLETIILNPFESKNEYPFLSNYYKTLLLSYYSQKDFIFIWKEYKEILVKENIGKNTFYKICRYYLIKQNNNELIKKIIGKNLKTHINSEKSYVSLLKKIDNQMKTINKNLEKIFNYAEDMTTEIRSSTLINLGVNVCPYCHRQFINRYEIDKKNRTIAQLDHFYPKKKYPLYAMTLYNFIPSCAHCNTILKKEKIFPGLFPINNKTNEEIYFRINYDSYSDMLRISDECLEIVNNESSLERRILKDIQNTNFAIKSMYKYHTEFIERLLQKKNLNNSSYKEQTEAVLRDKLNEKDFLELLFGFSFEEEEIYEKPLSKLAKDIIFNVEM